MILFITIILIIILILIYYKKSGDTNKNGNNTIPNKHYKEPRALNSSVVDNNEEPYYIYADADKHHEVHIDDHDETHVDDFEEL